VAVEQLTRFNSKVAVAVVLVVTKQVHLFLYQHLLL
jgi:hypothetical protein